MQFCTRHWQALRQAVKDRGMDHLVAASGTQAAMDAVAQVTGTDTLDNWDPLMAAHWAIASRVMQAVGLLALSEGFCPLCEVQRDYEKVSKLPEFDPERHMSPEFWVNDCMDAMLAYARQQGLMPAVQ